MRINTVSKTMVICFILCWTVNHVDGRAFLLDDGYFPEEMPTWYEPYNGPQFENVEQIRTRREPPYNEPVHEEAEDVRMRRQSSPMETLYAEPQIQGWGDTFYKIPNENNDPEENRSSRGSMSQRAGSLRRSRYEEPAEEVRLRRDSAYHAPNYSDDEEVRARRDTPYKAPVYAEAKSDHHHHYHKGKVGPVYTFVKTDHHANFKWGVRHKVGKHH